MRAFSDLWRPPVSLKNTELYYKDLAYAFSLGISQSLLGPIAIVVTMQLLGGDKDLVGLIQSGSMAGLLLSLFYTYFARNLGSAQAYAGPQLLAWLSVIICSLVDSASFFAALVFVSLLFLHISSPFLSTLYKTIYPAKGRGKIFGKVKRWQMLAVILSAFLVERLLEISPGSYWTIYFWLGVLGLATGFKFLSIDTQPHDRKEPQSGFPRIIRIFRHDKNFFIFMVFQFILGIANLSGLTAFYVYANDSGYLALSPATAALVTGLVTPVAMFFSIKLWSLFFDRTNIVIYRVSTSCVLGAAFLCLPFAGIYGAFIFAVIWGVGRAGGQIAWSLGILDFAPPEHTREYLSVHTFLTGVRGVIAPFIGIYLLDLFPDDLELLFLTLSLLIFLSAIGTYFLVEKPVERS